MAGRRALLPLPFAVSAEHEPTANVPERSRTFSNPCLARCCASLAYGVPGAPFAVPNRWRDYYTRDHLKHQGGTGNTRIEDHLKGPTQSHISPSIQQYTKIPSFLRVLLYTWRRTVLGGLFLLPLKLIDPFISVVLINNCSVQ
jgi:hypothetical protein